uniref:Uncharacterized protein n=1 Tax=Octopus bimaculoides TaxID=37653 RepID=A0A0L8HJ83_OCTBM
MEKMKTYAAATGSRASVVPGLLKQYEIHWNEDMAEKIEKYKEMIKKEGPNVKLTPSEEEKTKMEIGIVEYKSFSRKNNRIESATKEEVEECLKELEEDVLFFTRGKTYASVEITFVSEEAENKYANKTLANGNWMLFPNKLGRCPTWIRVGRIPPKIELEWVMAAVFPEREDVRIIMISRTQKINCWGYGLNVLFIASQKVYSDIPETLELPNEDKMDIMLEGRPPKCYECGKRDRQIHRCINAQTYIHSEAKKITQSCTEPENTNTQTQYADLQSHKHAESQTDKHTDIQSQRNIEQTHGSTESQKQKRTDIQTQEVHRNGIYLMSYRYTEKIEKIFKIKDIVKVDLSDGCDKETRWILIEKEEHKKLKEAFPTDINPLGPVVNFEPSAPVVNYEEIKDYMKW